LYTPNTVLLETVPAQPVIESFVLHPGAQFRTSDSKLGLVIAIDAAELGVARKIKQRKGKYFRKFFMVALRVKFRTPYVGLRTMLGDQTGVRQWQGVVATVAKVLEVLET
jgi:hypothetical protein